MAEAERLLMTGVLTTASNCNGDEHHYGKATTPTRTKATTPITIATFEA